MYIKGKTLTVLIFAVFLLSLCVSTASAENATVTDIPTITIAPILTPTPNATITPTPVATPVPTPAPRQVFTTASAGWNTDHESIDVVNTGAPITIIAWIDDPSNSATISVGASQSMTVSTPSIQAQNGQIVSFGFQAYENNTLIDSYNKTVAAITGPTPTTLPTESATISGIVTDADNGSSISGASVTFRSVSYEKAYPAVTTASDGSFISQKMYPDVYTITVSASGYQATSLTTSGKITGDATVSTIMLKKLAGNPTPTPLPPTPTPSSSDSWTSFMSSPQAMQVCLGSLSAFIAVIAGSIGIYEWLSRQRNARLKKEKEEGGKPGESKDNQDQKKL